jgi:hypothetical protein
MATSFPLIPDDDDDLDSASEDLLAPLKRPRDDDIEEQPTKKSRTQEDTPFWETLNDVESLREACRQQAVAVRKHLRAIEKMFFMGAPPQTYPTRGYVKGDIIAICPRCEQTKDANQRKQFLRGICKACYSREKRRLAKLGK